MHSPPIKTSTPRKMRNSGILNNVSINNDTSVSSFNEDDEENDDDDDDEYDLVEINSSVTSPISSKPSALSNVSCRTLSETADHKGWLWRKESLFKTIRYWSLIHQSYLYLFSDVNNDSYKERHFLENAYLKRHKKGVKFIVQVILTF